MVSRVDKIPNAEDRATILKSCGLLRVQIQKLSLTDKSGTAYHKFIVDEAGVITEIHCYDNSLLHSTDEESSSSDDEDLVQGKRKCPNDNEIDMGQSKTAKVRQITAADDNLQLFKDIINGMQKRMDEQEARNAETRSTLKTKEEYFLKKEEKYEANESEFKAKIKDLESEIKTVKEESKTETKDALEAQAQKLNAEWDAKLKAALEANNKEWSVKVEKVEKEKAELVKKSTANGVPALYWDWSKEIAIHQVIRAVKRDWNHNETDLMNIGNLIRQRYFLKYGRNPPWEKRYDSRGEPRGCYIYMLSMRPWMEEVAREYFRI